MKASQTLHTRFTFTEKRGVKGGISGFFDCTWTNERTPKDAVFTADFGVFLVFYLLAPLAQLDRASGFGPEGCGFDSCRARQQGPSKAADFKRNRHF